LELERMNKHTDLVMRALTLCSTFPQQLQGRNKKRKTHWRIGRLQKNGVEVKMFGFGSNLFETLPGVKDTTCFIK
jgi:hypothetical protein